MRSLLAIVVFFLSTSASAQVATYHHQQDIGLVLQSVACNASPSARTVTLTPGKVAGLGLINFQTDFTHNAASALSMTCYARLDPSMQWAQLQECNVSAGVCTSVSASWTKAIGASLSWLWRVDLLGAPEAQCIFACTGGGASDTFNVYARGTGM